MQTVSNVVTCGGQYPIHILTDVHFTGAGGKFFGVVQRNDALGFAHYARNLFGVRQRCVLDPGGNSKVDMICRMKPWKQVDLGL